MTSNVDQAEHWNSEESRHWVVNAERYDVMLGGYVEHILGAAGLASDDWVLDVGCGTGATTIAAAGVATAGDVLGVDLSGPMLEHARTRAQEAGLTNITFEQLDAQTAALADASRDAVISRFGVMFFEDPVAAFANIAGALRPGGRVAFACWKELLANEWMFVPGMAVAAHVPLPDPGEQGAPGPFAFGDPDRVREILETAGLRSIEVTAVDDPLLLGGHGTAGEAVEFLRGTGMARTLLADADPDLAERALDSVREALVPFETPDGVRLGAGAWLVTARR
ncbi:MAG TPA: methyltransferase domain-containing protein [Acidimicrobiia bacterium]|nr:methyltransferase domain-containing protein [Acidimicrobiia bacterium]